MLRLYPVAIAFNSDKRHIAKLKLRVELKTCFTKRFNRNRQYQKDKGLKMRMFKSLAFAISMAIPLTTLTLTASAPLLVNAAETSIYSHMATAHPVWAEHGMVASQEALATRAGVEILKQGGNAVDAAVAVGFSLAVTLPRAGNIGGGGFMLVHLAEQNKTVAIDYREMAPASAHKDIFLDEKGNAVNKLSREHGLAVGVPGTVMGME
ncbi:MAG: gamma-glutamyltranspeptidase/glutathione hydrolase, partial [Shewanella sp.]